MIGSLQSQIELEFRHDEKRSRTVLAKRQTGGLCHISKPYWDGEILGVQLVNPTAGMFAGDELVFNCHLGIGSQVAMTSPSAARYHTMTTGTAKIVQDFTLEEGAWLDFWPEMIIPQRESETIQKTRINFAEGARFVFLDRLAPGRVAHGESFVYRQLTSLVEVSLNRNLLAKERCVLSAEQFAQQGSTWPLAVPHRDQWSQCYYAAIWIGGKQEATKSLQVLDDLVLTEEGEWGYSQLCEDLAVIRLVSPSSIALNKSIAQIRSRLQDILPLLNDSFRKL